MKLQNLIHIVIGIVCIGLLPGAKAVVPAPDGGYPGGNTAEGQAALLSLTTGQFNTAVGIFSLSSNTEGGYNTAIGAGTLSSPTSASRNTAIGAAALFSDTTGALNTAVGTLALFSNNVGGENTAVGDSALFSNTTGHFNTANGQAALFSNTIGFENTAVGSAALLNNVDGDFNTAVGDNALRVNTSGNANTAIGSNALSSNSGGLDNTATGRSALFSNDTGSGNVATGTQALQSNISGANNTAVGKFALLNCTGGINTALGAGAGQGVTSANDVICIGANIGGMNVSNTTWIGNVFGVTTQNGNTAPVIVSSTGQLGTVASSERFKKDIATMEKASEVILSLRPVTFHYRSDAGETPQFGLIAEEVAKVNPALVLSDKEGKPYTVRYDAVNAMLLNEFLKEHRAVQELKATVAQQQKQIEALTAGLQKVSAQVEMNRTAPQVVSNNQ